MSFTGCRDDHSFGPAVQGCRDGFDFTIKFERIFLSIIPASIFISLALTRILILSRHRKIVAHSLLPALKLIVSTVYATLRLSLLICSAKSKAPDALFIASSTIAFLTALSIIVVSGLEHSRAPRPSVLLSFYLSCTTLFDIAQARTLWLASLTPNDFTFSHLYTAAVAVNVVLLVLESRQKSKWLRWDSKEYSPEETHGIFGLGAFVWLNRLFVVGYTKVLTLSDLYTLDQSMTTEALQLKLANSFQEGTVKGKKFRLAKALANAIGFHLLLPVGPRIAWTGFKFCQPFLINTLLDFLQQPADNHSKNSGYGLIGAAILIYTGIAFSTALYWYFHERTLCMARAALAGAVYKKTTELKLTAASDAAALTLMSTDVEKIRYGFLNLHELFYANLIEVGLACWLVQRQLGAAFVAPLLVVVGCTIGMASANRYTSRRQKVWMDKIQRRVGLTSTVITQMKSLKISGLTAPVEKLIQGMRVDELKSSSAFRTVHIIVLAFAYAPVALAPVMTFAVTSRTLDVRTIFTSVSYLVLLTDPLTYLFQNSPHLLAAFACLDRIQNFLEQDSRIDYRSKRQDASTTDLTKEDLGTEDEKLDTKPSVSVSDGRFAWEGSSFNLTPLHLTIPRSQLTIVVGPVASGKTTLCNAILAEVPVLQGQLTIHSGFGLEGVAYCDQTPYLSNTSIRENITGFSTFNAQRYQEVVQATMLERDFFSLPNGDESKVGSNGISLSGGQKQRVSIARALYHRSNFFLFDDVLSGLDAETEEQVFRQIFGDDGLLRRRNSTVVLCTHNTRHLPCADHIVALASNGSLIEQGTFSELIANQKYVHSLDVKQERKGIGGGTVSIQPEGSVQSHTAKAAIAEILASSYIEDKDRMTGDSTVYRHYIGSLGKRSLVAFVVFGLGWGFFYNWGNVWLKYWSEDVGSPSPSRSNSFYIGLYAIFQIAYLASMVLCFLICYRTMIQISGERLHKAALRTVINAPLSFFSSTDAGVTTNLFSQDMTLIDNELPVALTNLALDVCNAVGMAAVIATSSPYLAITYVPIAIILYGIQKFYLRTSRQLRLLDLEAKSPLYSHFLDTIRGLATFRAFGWVQPGIAINNALLDTSQRPFYLLSMVQRWLGFALQVVVAILAVSVVALATQVRSSATLTGASLITLMTFGDVLNYIIRWWTQLETSIGAVSRLKNFSEKVKPEDAEDEGFRIPENWPSRGEIGIAGVSASYSRNERLENSPNGGQVDTSAFPQGLAIRNLTLSIKSRERVAICGRSGSGKSSALLLLLRLLEPLSSCSRNIVIDSVPLHCVNRTVLRQRIIAMSQDPVFLPKGSSILSNLDPFGASSENDCLDVLERVGLKALVNGQPKGLQQGLDSDSLSQGQKQLFGLARAVLRRRICAQSRAPHEVDGEAKRLPLYIDPTEKVPSRSHGKDGGILLLDEVSSSVDRATERTMHQIILTEFENYTIVMVSHRLEMVMDFDTVVVMDAGSIAEKGNPKTLANQAGSRFRELYTVGRREAMEEGGKIDGLEV